MCVSNIVAAIQLILFIFVFGTAISLTNVEASVWTHMND